MSPHIQVKLLEFDAAIAAFLSADKCSIQTSLDHLLKVNDELHDMAEVCPDNGALRTILDSVERADNMLDECITKLGIN